MIDITLDDGTILDIETDDPAQANAAAWNYLADRARAQSATSPYPPQSLPSQQPGAVLAFAAPTNDAPAVNALGTTHTVASDGDPTGAPLWQRAVQQSRLSDDQRAMLRHELGPDAQSLSDEEMYASLARYADEKSGPGQTILIRARRTLGDDGWRAFAAAKLRSTGRNDPKADFDPVGFRAGWGGLSDNFKIQLAPEHRKAIDALDAAGRATGADGAPAPDPLAILQHQMGGNLVARWIAWPTGAPAVARWTREVERASRLPPERGALMQALANVALANAVAHVSGDDPAAIRARLDAGLPAEVIAAADDPFERAAARRRGEVGAMPPEELGQGAPIVDKVLAAVNPIGSAQAAENTAPATKPLRITVTRRSPDDEKILAAAKEIAQMSPIERVATFKRGQEVSRYEPTARDRIGGWLMSRGPHTLARQQFVEGLVGSTGTGSTGLSLIDFTPAGIPLALEEAARKGDAGEVALAILPGAPAAKPIPRLLGQFATTTPERILREIKEGRDYTVSLPSGRKPLDGYLVGNYRKEDLRNHVVPTSELKKEHIEQFVETNRAQLEKPDRLFQARSDPETGNTHLEVIRHFEPGNPRRASKFAERKGHEAGYDAGTGLSFPIKNFEEFIKSPELEQRVTQMFYKGRDYLGGKQWWDNTSLERVYGRENMPFVAAFLASTSPNATPEKNLQIMSEYMRRYLKGEPIIQPEWLVPAGTRTRTEGTKLGMEQSRKSNLERIERGAFDELQADKVHEMAKAVEGDPMAVVLDRIFARLAEKPSAGVFTNAREGVIRGKEYQMLANRLTEVAERLGVTPLELIGNVWAGTRETVRNTGELFGSKLMHHNVRGESKPLSAIFDDLIEKQAAHEKVSREEMVRGLFEGKYNLLSLIPAALVGGGVLSGHVPGTPASPEDGSVDYY